MSQPLFTAAFLVSGYDDSLKARMQYVGAIYSPSHKGYFLTQEQKDKMPETLPSSQTLSTVTTSSGNRSSSIFIEDMFTEWKVYGDTYKCRDKLKTVGAKWNMSDKSWRIPREKADKEQLEALIK